MWTRKKNYFQLCMYHWLLVEGIYLYVMVGVVYNTARVKMWMYKILGWGAPALIVSLWAVFASYVMEDQVCKKGRALFCELRVYGPVSPVCGICTKCLQSRTRARQSFQVGFIYKILVLDEPVANRVDPPRADFDDPRHKPVYSAQHHPNPNYARNALYFKEK